MIGDCNYGYGNHGAPWKQKPKPKRKSNTKYKKLLKASRAVKKLLSDAEVDFGDCDIMSAWKNLLKD